MLGEPNVQRALLLLDDALELCYDVMKLSLGRSALLDAAFERATLYRARLKRLKAVTEPGYSYWYECNSRHFVLALTPLTVADRFREMLDEAGQLDLYLGHAVGQRSVGPLHRTAGADQGQNAAVAEPVRLCQAGAAVRAALLPSPNQRGGRASWRACCGH